MRWAIYARYSSEELNPNSSSASCSTMEEPTMANTKGTDRGIFFRPNERGQVLGPTGERGDWWVVFYQDGRRHREKAGTKVAARDLYMRRRTEIRQGRQFPETMRPASPITVRELADAYLQVCRANRVRSLDRIERRLAEALGHLGSISARQLRPEDLERLKVRLGEGPRQKQRSPATINRFLQDLKAVFLLAVRSGVLDRSPMASLSLLTENNKRTRELTPTEEAEIMLALRGPRAIRAFVAFAIATGARAGEICRLEWRHVHARDGFAELPETKSGEKQHLVLGPAALGILAGLPRYGSHVFARPDGRPFARDYVSHAFQQAAVRAKVKDVRLHDLRHTYATRLRRAGADLSVLAALLRHASTRMSERYSHVSRPDLRRAVEAADFATELPLQQPPAPDDDSQAIEGA